MPTTTLPQVRFRTLDGVRIRCADTGGAHGPVILLTSPWPESLYAFVPIWNMLARYGRLFAIDLPGFGASERRDELMSPRAMGGFLAELIAEAGLGKTHIVAPDVGTSAALFAAAEHPERIASVVVGTGGAAVPIELGEPLRSWVLDPDLDKYRGMDARAIVSAAVDTIAGGIPDDIRADYQDCYDGDRFAESMAYVRRYPQELPELAELLPLITTPVTIINGRHDRVVPLANAEFLDARLPNSCIIIIDGGHFIWEEAPTEYASSIVEAITRPGRAMTAVGAPANHTTAQTRHVEAAGVEFAYRRFGRSAGLPLVMLQHFRGNLDNWDPALTDSLAAHREVILVDYPGVGSSTGAASSTIAGTARHVIAFATALVLDEIDLLGFSIGGFVAQEIALVRPALVRRLVLAATGPRGAPGMHGWREDIAAAARGESSPENLLYIMFAHTETSQAKGMEFLARFSERKEGRDAPASDAARDAEYDAIVEWGIPDHAALQRLTGIQTPTLIIQGDNDLMIPTKLSHLMAGLIPDAQIRIYPDAAHGFLFQYPAEVASEVGAFLAS
jgi:pimeloyl-ACP methyl ester carboxylesterase